MRRCLLPLLALLGGACEPSVIPQSELHTTRVLAIRADPPELLLLPDAGLPPPVHFSALTFTPDGGTPSVTFALCFAGDPFNPAFQCPGPDGLTLPDDTLDVTSPELQALLAAFDGGTLPDAGLPLLEPGVALVAIGYFATNGGTEPGDSERGVYQLSVRFSGRPNHNPELLGVTVPDGGPLEGALFPSLQQIQLTPQIPDGGANPAFPALGLDGGIEIYPSLDGGLTYENLNYSWYATIPEIIDFRSREPTPADTAETNFTNFQGDVLGPVTFYLVLRDGRGGTDWKVFNGAVLDGGR